MKIYVITENSQSNPNYEFTIGLVKFAFTSWKKADMQMNIIRNKIENGKWWWDANGENAPKGKILSDEVYSMNNEVYRDLCVESPNGWKTVYRMTPLRANCGYGFEM